MKEERRCFSRYRCQRYGNRSCSCPGPKKSSVVYSNDIMYRTVDGLKVLVDNVTNVIVCSEKRKKRMPELRPRLFHSALVLPIRCLNQRTGNSGAPTLDALDQEMRTGNRPIFPDLPGPSAFEDKPVLYFPLLSLTVSSCRMAYIHDFCGVCTRPFLFYSAACFVPSRQPVNRKC